ncbi:MAG TPA: hypothetical protein VGG98_01685 [Solirubrobacteraceae bacterium]
MSDITISRSMQRGLLLAILAAIAAIAVPQLPELQRYAKIRSM